MASAFQAMPLLDSTLHLYANVTPIPVYIFTFEKCIMGYAMPGYHIPVHLI